MCSNIKFLSIIYLTCISVNRLNALKWPQCGEFIFPRDDINLSTDEKQFRQKLPYLFDSYDHGNVTGIENTLKSLEKFKVPLTSEQKYAEKHMLSPSLEIVSINDCMNA